MSPSATDQPAGPSRRAILIAGVALGVLAGLGSPPGVSTPARAEIASGDAAAAADRPHDTLLGVL